MQNSNMLIRALRANALFSAGSAIAMLLAADWLARNLGFGGTAYVVVVAAGLLVFALQLGNIVRTREIRRWEILAIITADFGWVLGSGVLAVIFFDTISRAGLILIDIVAVVVLYLAVQQLIGLRLLKAEA